MIAPCSGRPPFRINSEAITEAVREVMFASERARSRRTISTTPDEGDQVAEKTATDGVARLAPLESFHREELLLTAAERKEEKNGTAYTASDLVGTCHCWALPPPPPPPPPLTRRPANSGPLSDLSPFWCCRTEPPGLRASERANGPGVPHTGNYQ